MDIYNAVLATIARKYAEQDHPDTLIELKRNEGNTGGHCDERAFTKNILYRVILPVALPSPENFVAVFSIHQDGKLKILSTAEKNELVTEYEESNTSFYIKFRKTVQGACFFTNII